MVRCRLLLVASLSAACGVRAPAPLDVAALVRDHGPDEARHALELRVVKDPRDVAARLALARLAEQQGRPSTALAQLDAVRALGGPAGPRWHDDDRARFARLLVARARARIARGAPSALADLERARALGATITARDLAAARRARAIVELRHVDREVRARGLRLLATLADGPDAEPAWRGARATATAAERGALGAWLWSAGAKRAAWETLEAWHAATPGPRDEQLQQAHLAARAWWMPVDAAPPGPAELVGPVRCAYAAAGCRASEVLALDGDAREVALAALRAAPPAPTSDPADAAAWLAITLRDALRGDGAWGARFASRVDLATIPTRRVPAAVRGTFARLAGRPAAEDAGDAPGRDTTALERLVIAAGVALRTGREPEVRLALGGLAATEDGAALVRVVASAATEPLAAPYAAAVARYARTRATVLGVPADAARLDALLAGYARDPLIADRLGRELVAAAPDAAAGHAVLGVVFEALGDPARARAAWQAAVAASPDLAFLRAHAEAIARAGDPDAALLAATTAAAASGDPSVVWVAVARELDGVGAHVHALEAARYAIELGTPDTLADALDVASAASRALGRDGQVAQLARRRAHVAPPPAPPRADDPTDVTAALAAHAAPTTETTQRLWIASRWNPRDVASRAALRELLAADPRHPTIIAELVALAGDRDAARARAAIRALR